MGASCDTLSHMRMAPTTPAVAMKPSTTATPAMRLRYHRAGRGTGLVLSYATATDTKSLSRVMATRPMAGTETSISAMATRKYTSNSNVADTQ